MSEDRQAMRRLHARRLLKTAGIAINGPPSVRMSFLAQPILRQKIEAIRSKLAEKESGYRNCNMSDVIRYCVNVLYFDLVGERPASEGE